MQSHSPRMPRLLTPIIPELSSGLTRSSSVTTNKFTCPQRGLYLFSLSFYHAFDFKDLINGAIMIDGNRIGAVVAWSDDDDEYGNTEGDQSSTTTVVVCDANQSAWVESYYWELYCSYIIGSITEPMTMFTGVLIQPL